ncbi:MAG: T9SS type A sorting domain-containing protein [Flavobacteriales bacterium]|nr:T9SS type A sorting domain-containing protein [Flavobacteriales bacterium]
MVFSCIRQVVKSLFTLLLVGTLSANGQIIFDTQYSSGPPAQLKCLRPTASGYVLGGSRVSHVDSAGNALLDFYSDHNRIHYVPADSGFVVAANVFITNSDPEVIGHIKRYDSSGNLVWDQVFDSGVWRNFAEDVIVLNSGSLIYAGRHQTVAGSGAVLRGLDSNGNMQWEFLWDTWPGSSYAQELFPRLSSLFVIGKANASYNGESLARDMFVSKHIINGGGELWEYVYDTDSTDDATDLLILTDESVLLLGHSNSDSSTVGPRGVLVNITGDSFLFETTENWSRLYQSNVPEKFNAIELAPDSDYIILGIRGDEGVDSLRTFLMKVDVNGDPEWEYIFASAGYNHQGIEMEREDSTVYVIAGFFDEQTALKDYYLTKVDLSNLPYTEFDNTTPVGSLATENIEIKLYPNPASSLLRIDLPTSIGTQNVLQVFDITGKRVDRFNSNSTHIFYACSKLKPGTYLIQVENHESLTRSFVVR